MLTRLQKLLDDAGIPNAGCSQNRIDFLPTATPEQRAAGKAILEGFDRRKRRERPGLRGFVNALSTADTNKLLRMLIVEKLREDPLWAKRHGVDLDGDEPEN